MRIVLDSETTGLDARTDRLVLVGAAGEQGEPVVLRHPDDRELIQQLLDADATFVGHNLGFDLAFLEAAGYRIPAPERWEDTVLIAHIAGESQPGQARLAQLTKNLIALGELPADTLEPEQQLNAWLRSARLAATKAGHKRPEKGDAPLHLLEPYLCADVRCTRVVHRFYARQASGQQSILQLERAVMPAVYATERRGVPLDLDAAHELRDRISSGVAQLRARMFELAGERFNPGSARQLERLLAARGVDLSTAERTRTGKLKIAGDTLERIDDDLARTRLAWAKEKKFGDAVEALYRFTHNGRLYGSFSQIGATTGRMASNRPNLQAIPKTDLRLRYVIAAGEGKVLVGADLDSVELRILSCYAPGGALERAFRNGADLHEVTATSLGLDRDGGKTLNYAITYGAGVPLIAERLGVSRDEAGKILDGWYRTYPEVRRLKGRLAQSVRRRGYLLSIGGRRHYFEQPNHMLLNRAISGSAADLFKRSLVELHRAGVPAVLYVHDEVVAEVDEADADRVAALLQAALTRPMRRPGVTIDGLVATAAIHKRWAWFKDPDYEPVYP